MNKNGDQIIPRVNAAEMELTVLDESKSNTAPLHVLFNQVGSNCTRFSKRITGTKSQQHFVQMLVSSIRGIAFPVLYLAATLFPGIYYSNATHDDAATLGCPVISSHRGDTHPNGFASHLQIGRNTLTHSSSSSSTCHNFASYCYDLQANRAASSTDSRLVTKQGFGVSKTSSNGLQLATGDESCLHESVDSSQAAINLAAASQIVQFDLFLTFTCNQSLHPGIRHLHDWKKSEGYTKMIDGWSHLPRHVKDELSRSFEMSYLSIVSRSWLEVRKLLLEFVIRSTSSILGRVVPAFFRDEFQEESGNLSHIHGLIGLHKGDMNDEEFKNFVCSLQRSAVCDLISSSEIKRYIDEGLLKDMKDYKAYNEQAACFLTHSCASGRCKSRVGDSGTPEDFRCKIKHPVLDSIDPQTDDFIPIVYDWTDSCLSILEGCDLYEKPSQQYPNGRFLHPSLRPTRHMGKVTPSTTEKLSPVIPEFFALNRSAQNAQVLTGTNGVARYVAKYIVKMDAGNRCVVWADSHTGAVSIYDVQFLFSHLTCLL